MLKNILKPGMKGLFYGRYSTRHQDLARQRNKATELVEKYHCEIVEEYPDKGVSARKNPIIKRKYLYKIIKELEEDAFKYDFIVVSEDDRLARKTIEHQWLRTTFSLYEVPIIVCKTESLYNPKEADILVQLISDGISQYEAQNIRKNTRDGLKARVKRGLWTGGQPPFGYKYNKETGKFIAFREELEIVKDIYSFYKQGLGFTSIAKQLPKEFNKGKEWSKDKVKGIITSPFYAGYLSWGKRTGGSNNTFTDQENWILIKSDQIEPIIDKTEWDYCWKLYMDKRDKKLPPKHYNTRFLLKGLAFCKHCKQELDTKNQITYKNEKEYGEPIYRCKSCSIRCNADFLHDLVIQRTLNSIVLTDTQAVLENLKQKVNNDIKSIESDIEKLKASKREYDDQIDAVKNKLQELMRDTRDEKDKKIISILSLLRLDIKQRLDNTLSLIKEKEREIKFMQEIDLNESNLLSLISDAHKDISGMANYELRKLLMHFIKAVEVDQNNKVTFVNRIDLKKQEADPQLVFRF